MLSYRKGVASIHQAQQEHFPITSTLLCVVGSVAQLGGEVHSTPVEAIFSSRNNTKALLTDLPHSCFAGPLQHGDTFGLGWVVVPLKLASRGQKSVQEHLSLIFFRQGGPVTLLEQRTTRAMLFLQGQAVMIKDSQQGGV